MGISDLLLYRSSTYAISKRCAAQTSPNTDVTVPCLVITAVAACGMLVRAQEVAPSPKPSSAQRTLRLADRLRCTDHPGAREPRRRDDLASPQAHLLG